MGADLYIMSIHNKNMDKYRPAYETACAKRDRYLAKHPETKPYIYYGYGERKEPPEELKKVVDLAQAHHNKVEEAYEKMYGDGYFRDSYNDSSVLWQLGLSWWTHVIPMCNDGELHPDMAQELLNQVKRRKISGMIHDYARKCDRPLTRDEIRYFEAKKKRLEKFLQTAIDLNEPIVASL